MTNQAKKPGRPPKEVVLGNLKEMAEAQHKEEPVKVGTFITVNTINVKGLRLNLDKVFSYAPNGDLSIQVAQGDGNRTTLDFGSKEEMLKTLELLDSRCQ